MANRWTRILTHRWHDDRDVARAFGEDALQRVEARVATSEKRHSGEIRVCIEAGLPLAYLWRGATARERAVALFGELRIWDTEHNNGVLVYLLLAERSIEIVADRGIHRAAGSPQWQRILEAMRDAFRAGNYEAGLNLAIDAVDDLLAQHFPLAPGETNPNELPDAPLLL
jgi:uncharacterized membrane protein YgcG